jgi:hypothetical protein
MTRSSGDENLIRIPDEAPQEVREFMDRGHRRASIDEGGRMMVDPGKVLTNIENTMRRIDADINTEVSVTEDVATEKELMVLIGDLMMGPTLITFLVNTGMDIMKAGGYPDDLVTNPLPDHYDLTALISGMTVNERQHEIAKAIFNRRTTSSGELTADDVDDDLAELDLAEKMEVFIILFWMWGTKIGAMKNVADRDH